MPGFMISVWEKKMGGGGGEIWEFDNYVMRDD